MAVSSIKDFWIHPNALTITLNYFGDPQLIQTSMLAGAVIMAYRKDVISYDAAHNFREWKLQAFPTQLNDTCAYYVHAELSRSGDTAMIVYSPVKRDIEGRSFIDGAWDSTTSSLSWFIYLGTISASVDNDGAPVERAWTDGFYTGTLDTDQQRMEEASGEWKTMFNYNAVTDQIEPLKPFSKIKVMGEAIFQSIAQFVNGLVIGNRTITDVAASSDSGNESKVSDATLPTTGYVAKEIEALDEHFLVKDGTEAQTVGGDVTFTEDVAVGGNNTIGGNQAVSGNQTIGGKQTVKGLQTLHEGFQTEVFSHVAGQTNGAMLTPDGLFYASGLIANSFRINELIYNIVKAQGGKTVLSNAGTVESCKYKLKDSEGLLDEYDGDTSNIDYVLLTIRADEHNKGAMPFEEEDILYGYVNNIGESGQVATGGECTMHVVAGATEDAPMTIKAQLYAINNTVTPDEPSYYDYVSSNIPPAPLMALAQRGNKRNKDRQSAIFLDGESGNIIMLQGVSTPRLRKEYYSTINGVLPYDLYKDIQDVFTSLRANDPVMFAKYGIFENLIQYDHQGEVLQRERNRGVWSKAVAESNVREKDEYRDRYKNTPSYYDTVTHLGQLYKCLKSDTIQEPSTGDDWLLLVAKGSDGDYLVYDLTPSANIIYIRDGNTPSINSLEVTVGESTPDGFIKINNQYELTKRNLKVQYAIDGVCDRVDLNIGSEDAIELEDGSGVIADELDAGTLYLEGVEIPFASIKDNITLYLVDENGADIVTFVIPVVHDGAEGDSPTTFHVEPSTVSVTLDANDDNLPVVFGCDIQIKFSVKKGDVFISPGYDDNRWYSSSDSRFLSFDDYTDDKYEYYHLKIDKGTKSEDIPNIITIPIRSAADDTQIGEVSISISKAQRGMVGDNGPMPIMSGWYDPSFAYKLAYSSEGKLIGRPVVSVRNANGNAQRYILNKDIPNDVRVEDGKAVAGVYPNIVDVSLSSAYWSASTRFSFLEAEILMADFASFGGTNGAVFKDKFLFSQKGITKYGVSSDWNNHSSPSDELPMFDANGNLSGDFTPNMFFNFVTGETKSNCFSEPFAQIETGVSIYRIDPTIAHNVSIQYGRGVSPIMIFMPQSENVTDGANCTIVYQSQAMQGLEKEVYVGHTDINGWDITLSSRLAIICADGRIPTMNGDYDADEKNKQGLFMVNGMPTRFLLIAPSDVVKMKSVGIKDNVRVWVVENQSDFYAVHAYYSFFKDKNGKSTEFLTQDSSYSGNMLEGKDPMTFATKAIFDFAPKDDAGDFDDDWESPRRLTYTVDISAGTVVAENNIQN